MMTDQHIAAVIAEWVLRGRRVDMDTTERGRHICAFSSVSDRYSSGLQDWLVVDRNGVRRADPSRGGWHTPTVICITSGKEHRLGRHFHFQYSKIAQKWFRKTLDALAV